MIGDILQPTHLLFVLVVALLVLGPKRLPEAGRALGRGLRDFRSAISGEDDHHNTIPADTAPSHEVVPPQHAATPPAPPAAAPAPRARTPTPQATPPTPQAAPPPPQAAPPPADTAPAHAAEPP